MDLKKLKLNSKDLDPFVIVGKNGLTSETIEHIKSVIKKKKLVKIKLSRSYLDSCMEECDFSRKEIAQNIADKTNSILVDYVGLTVCLARKGW